MRGSAFLWFLWLTCLQATANLPLPFLYNGVQAYNALESGNPDALNKAGESLRKEGIITLGTLGLARFFGATPVTAPETATQLEFDFVNQLGSKPNAGLTILNPNF